MKEVHSPNWGGKRPGAGRKPTDIAGGKKKERGFYINDTENELLRKFLKELREKKAAV